ncbi:cytochrome b/b6 domain-containing protein [Acerihabitans sp. TG2]|uniref:cytochrome b/b6 domain-containing protein n=1 Tax=Acerihabitans sp. TG2 TaxID=3096008 RepID=UPI002B22A90E|nr:cytochrome b/b6 domain-containing protein [Acerihabitans sp. TG2]MEA9389698.1 cytochrome b/b6 domain-containing protein [Acerihabitans sp. TG2]
MKIFTIFWAYLAQTQSRFLRVLHLAIALFVIIQILNSNGIQGDAVAQVNEVGMRLNFTWMHIVIGIMLFLLSLVLTAYCLFTRGVKYFYPYLWGDFSQIKRDLKQILRLNFPEASPKGLAACVQGLGLGALLLVVLSGLSWFLLSRMNVSWAANVLGLHKTLTALIEVYIFAHGGMGILHVILSHYMKKGVLR